MKNFNSNKIFFIGFFNGFFNFLGLNFLPTDEVEKIEKKSSSEKIAEDVSKINSDFKRSFKDIKSNYIDFAS